MTPRIVTSRVQTSLQEEADEVVSVDSSEDSTFTSAGHDDDEDDSDEEEDSVETSDDSSDSDYCIRQVEHVGVELLASI